MKASGLVDKGLKNNTDILTIHIRTILSVQDRMRIEGYSIDDKGR